MSWGRTPDESPPVVCLPLTRATESSLFVSSSDYLSLSTWRSFMELIQPNELSWRSLVPLRLDGSFRTETKDQHKKPWMGVFDLLKWPVLWPSSFCDCLLTVAKKASFPSYNSGFTLLVHWPILSRGPSDVYWILTTVLPVWHQTRHMVKHTASQVWVGRDEIQKCHFSVISIVGI